MPTTTAERECHTPDGRLFLFSFSSYVCCRIIGGVASHNLITTPPLPSSHRAMQVRPCAHPGLAGAQRQDNKENQTIQHPAAGLRAGAHHAALLHHQGNVPLVL